MHACMTGRRSAHEFGLLVPAKRRLKVATRNATGSVDCARVKELNVSVMNAVASRPNASWMRMKRANMRALSENQTALAISRVDGEMPP